MMTSYIILKGWHLLLILLAPSITKVLDKLAYFLWKHYIKPKSLSDLNGDFKKSVQDSKTYTRSTQTGMNWTGPTLDKK